MNGYDEEQRHTERVEQLEADLEAAREELNALAYSISHDLRAPLRAVDGFSTILMEDFAESLDPEARMYLEKIRRNATTMNAMIDALLELSRLGRHSVVLERVDPADAVREALRYLRVEREGRVLEINVGDMPTCHADPQVLVNIYQNLLSNAIKFTGKQGVAHIEIGAVNEDGATIFYVRDDGAGFDMRYVNKLFGAFQRLHSPDEFEGVGIGLALVRRGVSMHRGRVWAEAEVNGGATFYFTLSAS
jgi:light-regulated signal transduction histidine kinase (bacteriophytochrome)